MWDHNYTFKKSYGQWNKLNQFIIAKLKKRATFSQSSTEGEYFLPKFGHSCRTGTRLFLSEEKLNQALSFILFSLLFSSQWLARVYKSTIFYSYVFCALVVMNMCEVPFYVQNRKIWVNSSCLFLFYLKYLQAKKECRFFLNILLSQWVNHFFLSRNI